MKPTKSQRQASLLQLIREQAIGTQEELVSILNQSGLFATQATISRDIKELGIIKATDSNGHQKYIAFDRGKDAPSGRLMKVFSEAVVKIDAAVNLVIIKTLPGMAQASASALDSMNLSEVVGTIAGDDTVFIAVRSEDKAHELTRLLNQLMVSST